MSMIVRQISPIHKNIDQSGQHICCHGLEPSMGFVMFNDCHPYTNFQQKT